jgi:hypothetical protein
MENKIWPETAVTCSQDVWPPYTAHLVFIQSIRPLAHGDLAACGAMVAKALKPGDPHVVCETCAGLRNSEDIIINY